MGALEKMLGLATIGSVTAELLVLRRFLLGMATVLLFFIIIAILIAALVVTVLYITYSVLVEHGMSMNAAMWLITGGMVAIIAALTATAMQRLHRLRRMLSPHPPLTVKLTEMVEAFIEGVLEPPISMDNP